MSDTFTFDNKLNDYSSIGIGLSGGIDSALLLYYLLKNDYKVKCYTLIDKNNDNNREAATAVKELIETKTSKTVMSHDFYEYIKENPKDKKTQMTKIWTGLIADKSVDCIISGGSQHLSSVKDTWGQKDSDKTSEKVWTESEVYDSYVIYRPFLSYDKSWIKTCCDACNLTEELLKITVSCLNKPAPCKNCLWCAEKYEIFKCY